VGTIEELFRRWLQSGDEAAMDALVRATRPRLLAIARRIGAPQDAEDAVQSAYLALARRRGEGLDAPVLPWLVTAVVRIAYRKKAVERRQHELARRLAQESAAPSPAAAAIAAETGVRLREQVAKLPAAYRDPIVLHYLEGLSTSEIAQLLDISVDAVRVRLHRGRVLA
jgi:RNA polymerase sigma-70 factor (ECF subfamily)